MLVLSFCFLSPRRMMAPPHKRQSNIICIDTHELLYGGVFNHFQKFYNKSPSPVPQQVTKEVRIPALLINIQHDQLAKMGVSKEDGQNALNAYTRTTAAHDAAAHKRMEDFTHT